MENFIYHLLGICGEHAATHPSLITLALVAGVLVLSVSAFKQFTMSDR